MMVSDGVWCSVLVPLVTHYYACRLCCGPEINWTKSKYLVGVGILSQFAAWANQESVCLIYICIRADQFWFSLTLGVILLYFLGLS